MLRETAVEVPQPGRGQVRVRVKAAGLNALDGKKRSGTLDSVFPTTFPAIPGGELAGVVDALGDGVSDVQVGDEVLGWADTGAYAEYALATTGSSIQDYHASLGATPTTYGEGLVERVRSLAPDGVDAVFDLAGKGARPDSITSRGGTERIVTIADFSAGQLGVTFSPGGGDHPAERLAAVAQDAAARRPTTTVTSYPLAKAADAQQASDAEHVRGKLVLAVD